MKKTAIEMIKIFRIKEVLNISKWLKGKDTDFTASIR